MNDQTISKTAAYAADGSLAGTTPSRISTFIFLLLCFVPVFSTLVFGAVDSATWVFISIFWAIITLLWLADAWNSGGFVLNTSSLQIPIAGLLLIGLVQLLPIGGGDVAGVSASGALSLDPNATRFFVIRLLVFLTFLAASLAFINSEKRLKAIVLLIVIFGSLMAFFGTLQRLANPDGIYGMRLTPQAIPFGPFINQHHFAAFMQMTGGLALGLLMGSETTRDKKLMLATALVIMGVATVFTGSRGGLIGFVAAMMFAAVVSFLSNRSGKHGDEQSGTQGTLIMAAGGIALILVVLGTALFLGGNDSLLRGIGVAAPEGDISTGRLHFWPIALRIFLEHPIIGAGFDAFGVAFTKFDSWSGAFRVEQAHNEYLQILADGGLAGLLCILGFIFLLFRKGLATISSTNGFRRSAAIGALGGCLGIMVHSFFDFPLRTNSNAFFFLLLAAIATVTVSGEHKHRHRRHHKHHS